MVSYGTLCAMQLRSVFSKYLFQSGVKLFPKILGGNVEPSFKVIIGTEIVLNLFLNLGNFEPQGS